MLAVAGLYDAAQAGVNLLQGINAILPGVGVFLVYLLGIPLTIWAWLTFYVWFKVRGVSFMQPKRFAIVGICGLADTIVSALPAWIAAVALLIATTRAEELLEKVPGGEKLAKVAHAAGGKPGAAIASLPQRPSAPPRAAPPPHSGRVPPRLADVRSPV